MNAIGLALPGLPLRMICAEDGTVSFHKLALFKTIIDAPCDGVQAIISEEDIYIGANTVVEYDTRYHYKEMPELLAWLQAQKLEMPRFN